MPGMLRAYVVLRSLDKHRLNFSILNCDNRIISYISENDLQEEKILKYLNFHVDFTLQNRAS